MKFHYILYRGVQLNFTGTFQFWLKSDNSAHFASVSACNLCVTRVILAKYLSVRNIFRKKKLQRTIKYTFTPNIHVFHKSYGFPDD
jgi:hypothetical protein